MTNDIAKQSKAEDDRPHPKVGAVVVMNDEVLGTAYRGELGSGDHAEYTLLGRKLADVDLKGATLFTTLEPCTERRKHKPCVDWIIERGIANAVIGILDPNPLIYNKGASKLKRYGV